MNTLLSLFQKLYDENSSEDAKDLSYSECLFDILFPEVCCYYVKNCRTDWDFEPICQKDLTIVFIGMKQDHCVFDSEADGHRNAIFFYNDDKTYFWFDPEGSKKRVKNIKSFLKKLGCEDYKEIKGEYPAVQVEPKDDQGYCATWCYLVAYLSVLYNLRGLEMTNFFPKISGKMKLMKGFATYFKNKIDKVRKI